jgi:selenocysteine lyase/cysteine desulfurase
LANLSADDLAGDFAYQLRDDLGSRAYDLFCTANFLNYMPWTASIQYLLSHGIEQICAHNEYLVSHLINNLDRRQYAVLSPEQGPAQGSIAILRHRKNEKNRDCFRRLRDAGVDVAFRKGNLRVSPHLYNCQADIERLLDILQG